MKNKIIICGFVMVLGFFPLYGLYIKDEEISYSERRKLASFPEFSLEDVFDGEYFNDVNDYLVDHFPFRDDFRSLKGITSSKVFRKKENNGVFIKDDYLYQLNTSIDESSINHFTNILSKVHDDYLKDKNIYYSIVPDKNYYLKDKSIPKLNYEELYKQVGMGLPNTFKYIDITNELNNDSYYRTDIHWRQESLKPVVDKLTSSMQVESFNFPNAKENYSPFYGALYGRVASNVKPDTLTYLTSENIEKMKVYNYEKQRYENVYQKEYLKHIDSYDVYLSGATPLLIIDNPSQINNKELVLFRDSFGSSIAPILAQSYSKVTIIDLRYLSSSLLGKIEEIDFSSNNLDVLFLYSVPIINDSFTLK